MTEDTKVDKILKRIKNNRWLSYLIVIGLAFLAFVSIAEGLQKAGKIFGNSFADAQVITNYDAATKEALISVARNIDEFFLKLENEQEKGILKTQLPFYLEIEADLRSILLRNRVRPLNDLAVKQSELLLENWSNVKQLLEGELNRHVAKITKDILFQQFEAILRLEEAKKVAKE